MNSKIFGHVIGLNTHDIIKFNALAGTLGIVCKSKTFKQTDYEIRLDLIMIDTKTLKCWYCHNMRLDRGTFSIFMRAN